MLTILALVPILLVIVLLIWLKMSSRMALYFAWFAAAVLAGVFWGMPYEEVMAWSALGALKALDIVLIIFGAILLLNALKTSGGMKAIEGSLMEISTDARVQALLIGWLFVSFMEGAAGFGVPAALAAPLLISAGFAPLASVAFALVCNVTATSFGAIGTPTLTMLSIVPAGAVDAGATVALTAGIHALVGLFVPLVGMFFLLKLQKVKDFKKRFREIVPFSLLAGGAFVAPYFILAVVFAQVELPSLVGAVIGLAITILFAKKGWLVPKKHLLLEKPEEIAKEEKDLKKMGVFKAWLPYIIIVAVLVLTRLPCWDLGVWLKSLSFSVADIFGVDGVTHTVTLLWSPGLWFVLVAVATVFLHGIHKRKIGKIFKQTFKQIWGAAVALVFGVALTQIMINSGNDDTVSMVGAIALGLSQIFGPLYLVVAPILGALGAFVSGSNTVSNMLFTPSQFSSALQLGLPISLILALQNVGGSLGNMIAVNNIVAASATAGITGEEGKIIRTNMLPLAITTAATIIVGVVIYLIIK